MIILRKNNGEEKLYSVLMDEEELALFSEFQKEFSDKKEKDEPKLKTGDKVGIWTQKHLNFKKDREAVIEGYGEGKYHKLGKRSALYGGISGSLLGAGRGYVMGGKRGAVIGAAAGGATGAGTGYAGARLEGAVRNLMAKHSGTVYDENQRIADRARVANGDMTKKQYAKKYYKK